MLAYGYKILCNDILDEYTNKTELSFPTIVISEANSSNIKEKLTYKLTFNNNQGRNVVLYTNKRFVRTTKHQLWVFEVKDLLTLYWYSGTQEVRYIAYKNFTYELLKYWCLHIFLPTLFTIEETYDFLHAGAVELEEKPILFVAESFGGKSTMTDFFIKQGHTMVSDDKVGTYEKDGLYYAVPSHPYHRPHRGMEDLGFFVSNTSKEPKPIHAIYELEKAEPEARITITELSGIEKFKSLRYSSEINLSFLKSKRFVFLSKLAASVPVYKVTVPWDIERLDEVYDAIVTNTKE